MRHVAVTLIEPVVFAVVVVAVFALRAVIVVRLCVVSLRRSGRLLVRVVGVARLVARHPIAIAICCTAPLRCAFGAEGAAFVCPPRWSGVCAPLCSLRRTFGAEGWQLVASPAGWR
eukprot:4413132-Prymnesium_polylepis.1